MAFVPPFNRCLTLQKPNAIPISNLKPTMSIGSRHEIKTDYYTIWLSNPDLVFTIQVCSSTYVQFTSHLVMALISDFFEYFKKLFIKTKKNYIKVSSGTSLGPLFGPDSGLSPLPLGPCNFSFATKARPCDSNSHNLVDLDQAS